MTTIGPKEKLDKVTILLPGDTVARLDFMAQKALMGSRGRVIQSLVDSVWESQYDIQLIQGALNAFQNQPKELQSRPESFSALLFGLIFPLGNVVRRLNMYLGVGNPSTPVLQSQPQPNPTQPAVKPGQVTAKT